MDNNDQPDKTRRNFLKASAAAPFAPQMSKLSAAMAATAPTAAAAAIPAIEGKYFMGYSIDFLRTFGFNCNSVHDSLYGDPEDYKGFSLFRHACEELKRIEEQTLSVKSAETDAEIFSVMNSLHMEGHYILQYFAHPKLKDAYQVSKIYHIAYENEDISDVLASHDSAKRTAEKYYALVMDVHERLEKCLSDECRKERTPLKPENIQYRITNHSGVYPDYSSEKYSLTREGLHFILERNFCHHNQTPSGMIRLSEAYQRILDEYNNSVARKAMLLIQRENDEFYDNKYKDNPRHYEDLGYDEPFSRPDDTPEIRAFVNKIRKTADFTAPPRTKLADIERAIMEQAPSKLELLNRTFRIDENHEAPLDKIIYDSSFRIERLESAHEEAAFYRLPNDDFTSLIAAIEQNTQRAMLCPDKENKTLTVRVWREDEGDIELLEAMVEAYESRDVVVERIEQIKAEREEQERLAALPAPESNAPKPDDGMEPV